jgi:hypothetical protein
MRKYTEIADIVILTKAQKILLIISFLLFAVTVIDIMIGEVHNEKKEKVLMAGNSSININSVDTYISDN